ncbi:MAG: hypothetical protein NVS3B24_01800 [Candidatus Dormibacteria bacterium]
MTDSFAAVLVALRKVLDAVRLADMPRPEAERVAAMLLDVAAIAARHPGTPGAEPTSRRPDLPGRGNAVIPGFTMNDEVPGESSGTGTFSAAHLGRGVVHGGSVTMIFDEVMGRLVERDGTRARTAYLRVDFRALTPVDAQLELHARIDRREGRKIYASASLRQGARLLAEAEGLWVMPRSSDE